MADVHGLTKAEGRLIQMVIDHVRSHGYDVPDERQRRYPVSRTVFVVPDQAVSAGKLSSPNNVFSVWDGPGADVDADTGEDIEADFAAQDFAVDDYCLAVIVGGKWYVSCFLPGGAPTP